MTYRANLKSKLSLTVLAVALIGISGCQSNGVNNAGFDNVNQPQQNTGTTTPGAQPVSKPVQVTTALQNTGWVSTANTLHTVEFGKNGKTSGIAGCNAYQGFYGESAQGVTFTGITPTKNTCASSIMVEAEIFISLLQKVSNFQRIGETIVLKDSTGATLLVLKKQAK